MSSQQLEKRAPVPAAKWPLPEAPGRSFGAQVDEKKKREDEHFAKIKKLVKVLFLILCLGGCLYQVIALLILFFTYPEAIVVSMEEAPALTLPGITICNSNSIRLDRLKEAYPKFRDNWTILETEVATDRAKSKSKAKNLTNYKEPYGVSVKKQKLIDPFLRKVLQTTACNQISKGPLYQDLLDMKDFKCAADENNVNNNGTPCRTMLDPITTSQVIGNCFTLFHGSKKGNLIKMQISPGYSEAPIFSGNGNDSVKVEISQQPFQPNEVVRFRMNFSPEQYTNINDPVYGTITLHDPTEAPDTRKRRFRVFPGRYYEFYIMKQDAKLLPKPYKSNCYDYTGVNLGKYGGFNTPHPYIDAPLSRGDCITGCLIKRSLFTTNCKCWPPELPFIDGYQDQLVNGSTMKYKDIKFCDWNDMAKKGPYKTGEAAFSDCFAGYEPKCQETCNKDCLITKFLVDVQSFEWPAKERIEHTQNSTELEKLLTCCATISIRYWRADTILHDHGQQFKGIELISYVGGIVAMWLGFSFLGCYESFESFYHFVVKKVKERKEKSDTRLVSDFFYSRTGLMKSDPTKRSSQVLF